MKCIMLCGRQHEQKTRKTRMAVIWTSLAVSHHSRTPYEP